MTNVIYKSQKVLPFQSVKDFKNAPIQDEFYGMTNKQMFLSSKNIYYIINMVVSLNKRRKTDYDLNTIIPSIPGLMSKWATDNSIDDYEYLTDDISQTIFFINKQFLINNSVLYKIPNDESINVFRTKDVVTDRCGRPSIKKYDEMLAEDYHTLDLWQTPTREIFRYNENFRYNNEIPTWQKSMQTRHYDTDNDGLSSSKYSRASIEQSPRGYNMENIIKGGIASEKNNIAEYY